VLAGPDASHARHTVLPVAGAEQEDSAGNASTGPCGSRQAVAGAPGRGIRRPGSRLPLLLVALTVPLQASCGTQSEALPLQQAAAQASAAELEASPAPVRQESAQEQEQDLAPAGDLTDAVGARVQAYRATQAHTGFAGRRVHLQTPRVEIAGRARSRRPPPRSPRTRTTAWRWCCSPRRTPSRSWCRA